MSFGSKVTLVGTDVSRPAPMYRPVRNPPHAWMNVLKLIIGLAGFSASRISLFNAIIGPRWLFALLMKTLKPAPPLALFDDYGAAARVHRNPSPVRSLADTRLAACRP